MSKQPSCACCADNAGEFYPVLCLIAEGFAYGDHEPARAVLCLPMCASCAAKTEASDLLLPATRARLTAAMRAEGKVPPDYDQAWLEFGTIGDSQWIEALGPQGATLQ